jgi:hypothetical protein
VGGVPSIRVRVYNGALIRADDDFVLLTLESGVGPGNPSRIGDASGRAGAGAAG